MVVAQIKGVDKGNAINLALQLFNFFTQPPGLGSTIGRRVRLEQQLQLCLGQFQATTGAGAQGNTSCRGSAQTADDIDTGRIAVIDDAGILPVEGFKTGKAALTRFTAISSSDES